MIAGYKTKRLTVGSRKLFLRCELLRARVCVCVCDGRSYSIVPRKQIVPWGH